MRMRSVSTAWPGLLGVAVALGLTIAAVDNFALGGEVSPMIVVAMLLGATATVGVLGSRRAWAAALALWAWVPLAHLAKHVLGVPDTLHPNTYTSILKLGVFSLAVAMVGTAGGVLLRRVAAGGAGDGPARA